jgi:glucuronyl/N-acetylglucosaminyl transferase EXT1
MKNPKIYFVTILLILIALNIFERNYSKRKNEVIVTASVWPRSANSFLNYKQATELYSTSGTRQVEAALLDQCSMKTCFDFAKCNSSRPFKIHIMTQNDHTLNSAIYKRILNLTKNSKYYTDKQEDACVNLLSVDTLDRDRLSTNYVKNFSSIVGSSNETWRNGQNHLIFNLYAGTWPNYTTNELGFNKSKSILAQASIAHEHYQQNYDISFPLFHSSLEVDLGASHPHPRKYLLTFKGKRYLIGPASQLRNSLYHLNNGRDIVLLTTCNHTANLNNIKEDERCEFDDSAYNKWSTCSTRFFSSFF